MSSPSRPGTPAGSKQDPRRPTIEALRALLADRPDLTCEQAATVLGISKQRVSQLARRAGLKRLWMAA